MIQGIALAQLQTRRFAYLRQQLACDRAASGQNFGGSRACHVLWRASSQPGGQRPGRKFCGNEANFRCRSGGPRSEYGRDDSAQRMDWFSKIGPRDAERRKQVMDLISRGVLHTGEDFDEAAFVFHAW